MESSFTSDNGGDETDFPTTKEIMFQYAKRVNGNWDLKEFEKECKTDWDTVIVAAASIDETLRPNCIYRKSTTSLTKTQII
ncbi:hypothetical protein Bca101_027103 [Brassica carinata]